MIHLAPLIKDLALLLCVASVITLLFRRFKWPVVLAYIITGFLIGPHFKFFPSISDMMNIRAWADIGVIFLLFSLGLEFSFKKLARVGAAATLTAAIEVIVMMSLGFITGKILGWNNMDSLFLGGILSISSTTIIVRSFEECGVKGRAFVNLVFGVLVVEDLIAILLLVLLSSIAISKSAAGVEMFFIVGKLIFFLILWFLAGVLLLPIIIKKLRKFLNDEILLLVSLGLCFLMVYVTTLVGFSPALGAFLMGAILAETSEGHRIEHTIKSAKDLFAAIFFISVGMMVGPKSLILFFVPIVFITIVTIMGIVVSTAFGFLISGKSFRESIQSGLGLAQIGEFSFIIASLGLELKVTSDFLYSIAVGVSIITMFIAPLMIKSSETISRKIQCWLPRSWMRFLMTYNQTASNISFVSDWWILFRAYSLRVIANAVLASSVFLVVGRFFLPQIQAFIKNVRIANTLGLLIAVLLAAPFFWAMIIGKGKQEAVQKILLDPDKKKPVLLFEISRWVITFGLFVALASLFVTFSVALAISFVGVILLLLLLTTHLEGIYGNLENQFLRNLAVKDHHYSCIPPLAPWDVHLTSFEIHPTAKVVGKTLEELHIRERFGVTVALIERGGRSIPAPRQQEMLFPFDTIFVIGTDEEIIKFRTLIEKTLDSRQDSSRMDDEFNYDLISCRIHKTSPYCSRTIRNSGIREKTQGLVVGIERSGKRILNPEAKMKIEEGDLLWIVGDRDALKEL